MSIVAVVLVALVALLHLYILVLEMFLWTDPRGRKGRCVLLLDVASLIREPPPRARARSG